jgi:hypothetical protein
VIAARETGSERTRRGQGYSIEPHDNDTITSGESYDLEHGGIRVHLENRIIKHLNSSNASSTHII